MKLMIATIHLVALSGGAAAIPSPAASASGHPDTVALRGKIAPVSYKVAGGAVIVPRPAAAARPLLGGSRCASARVVHMMCSLCEQDRICSSLAGHASAAAGREGSRTEMVCTAARRPRAPSVDGVALT